MPFFLYEGAKGLYRFIYGIINLCHFKIEKKEEEKPQEPQKGENKNNEKKNKEQNQKDDKKKLVAKFLLPVEIYTLPTKKIH